MGFGARRQTKCAHALSGPLRSTGARPVATPCFHNTATSSAVLIRLRLPSHSGFKSPVSAFVPRLRRGYLCYSSSRCKSRNKHVTKSSHLGVRLSGSRRAYFAASHGPCHLQGARQPRKQAMNNLLTNEARLFNKPRGACPRKTFSPRPTVRCRPRLMTIFLRNPIDL